MHSSSRWMFVVPACTSFSRSLLYTGRGPTQTNVRSDRRQHQAQRDMCVDGRAAHSSLIAIVPVFRCAFSVHAVRVCHTLSRAAPLSPCRETRAGMLMSRFSEPQPNPFFECVGFPGNLSTVVITVIKPQITSFTRTRTRARKFHHMW